MKYRARYVYSMQYGSPHHQWEIVGPRGGLHFHISVLNQKFVDERYSAGIEYHWRNPPHYMRNNAPSSDKCWLLGCPCWHDGSSLFAREELVPFWDEGRTSHDAMFLRLQSLADLQFDPPAEDAP